MSAASGQCGSCKKDFCCKQAHPELCLTQCGHIFHKECIFVEGKNDKMFVKVCRTNAFKPKVLACPTCKSHELRPVIVIYPTFADPEESIANEYESMARSVPQIITTGKESIEENEKIVADLQLHSTLVSDFNDLLAKTLKQYKFCEDTRASNAELEREIAELKEKIEEQEKEKRGLLKRNSTGQQVAVNQSVAAKVEPEYPNRVSDETNSEDELMQGGIEVDYIGDEILAEEEVEYEEEADDGMEADDEDDPNDDPIADPDFEPPASDFDSDDDL